MITGSFNFNKAAKERNAENLLVLHSKKPPRSLWRIGMSIGGVREPMSGDKPENASHFMAFRQEANHSGATFVPQGHGTSCICG